MCPLLAHFICWVVGGVYSCPLFIGWVVGGVYCPLFICWVVGDVNSCPRLAHFVGWVVGDVYSCPWLAHFIGWVVWEAYFCQWLCCCVWSIILWMNIIPSKLLYMHMIFNFNYQQNWYIAHNKKHTVTHVMSSYSDLHTWKFPVI